MIVASDPATRAPHQRRARHQYVMMFRASENGLAKRVEFCAENAGRAVDMALADRGCRTVDIMEDGDFLCRISREQASPGAAKAQRQVA